MKFRCQKMVHREGSNANGKPWAMDIVSGTLVNEDKTEEVGELVLPKEHAPLVVGATYDVVLGARSMKGRIEFVPLALKKAAA